MKKTKQFNRSLLAILIISIGLISSCNKKLKEEMKELDKDMEELKAQNNALQEQLNATQNQVNNVSSLLGTNEPITFNCSSSFGGYTTEVVNQVYSFKGSSSETQSIKNFSYGIYLIQVSRYQAPIDDNGKSNSVYVSFIYDNNLKQVTDAFFIAAYTDDYLYSTLAFNSLYSYNSVNVNLNSIDFNSGSIDFSFSASSTSLYSNHIIFNDLTFSNTYGGVASASGSFKGTCEVIKYY